MGLKIYKALRQRRLALRLMRVGKVLGGPLKEQASAHDTLDAPPLSVKHVRLKAGGWLPPSIKAMKGMGAQVGAQGLSRMRIPG